LAARRGGKFTDRPEANCSHKQQKKKQRADGSRSFPSVATKEKSTTRAWCDRGDMGDQKSVRGPRTQIVEGKRLANLRIALWVTERGCGKSGGHFFSEMLGVTDIGD